MYKKFISIFIFVLIIVLGYTQKDGLLLWMKEGGAFSVFISILSVFIVVFFPIIPFPVLGGIIGAIFGIWEGLLISLTGAMLGTMVLFFLARYGFGDWAQSYVKKHPKVNEYEAYFEKNSFLAIFLSRVIPVVPSNVVNVVCGLSNVKWYIFFVASLLGKIPNFVLVSFAGANFEKSKWLSIGIYGFYSLIIFVVGFIFFYRKMPNQQVK